jgi:hypothetical protein
MTNFQYRTLKVKNPRNPCNPRIRNAQKRSILQKTVSISVNPCQKNKTNPIWWGNTVRHPRGSRHPTNQNSEKIDPVDPVISSCYYAKQSQCRPLAGNSKIEILNPKQGCLA